MGYFTVFRSKVDLTVQNELIRNNAINTLQNRLQLSQIKNGTAAASQIVDKESFTETFPDANGENDSVDTTATQMTYNSTGKYYSNPSNLSAALTFEPLVLSSFTANDRAAGLAIRPRKTIQLDRVQLMGAGTGGTASYVLVEMRRGALDNLFRTGTGHNSPNQVNLNKVDDGVRIIKSGLTRVIESGNWFVDTNEEIYTDKDYLVITTYQSSNRSLAYIRDSSSTSNNMTFFQNDDIQTVGVVTNSGSELITGLGGTLRSYFNSISGGLRYGCNMNVIERILYRTGSAATAANLVINLTGNNAQPDVLPSHILVTGVNDKDELINGALPGFALNNETELSRPFHQVIPYPLSSKITKITIGATGGASPDKVIDTTNSTLVWDIFGGGSISADTSNTNFPFLTFNAGSNRNGNFNRTLSRPVSLANGEQFALVFLARASGSWNNNGAYLSVTDPDGRQMTAQLGASGRNIGTDWTQVVAVVAPGNNFNTASSLSFIFEPVGDSTNAMPTVSIANVKIASTRNDQAAEVKIKGIGLKASQNLGSLM